MAHHGVSVADLIAFDALMDSFEPSRRESIERAIAHKTTHVSEEMLADEYQEGYRDGQNAERRKHEQDGKEKKAS